MTYHLPSGCATVCATWAHPRWSHPSDLNRRPNAYKAIALSSELQVHEGCFIKLLVELRGFEPATVGSEDRCSIP